MDSGPRSCRVELDCTAKSLIVEYESESFGQRYSQGFRCQLDDFLFWSPKLSPGGGPLSGMYERLPHSHADGLSLRAAGSADRTVDTIHAKSGPLARRRRLVAL